MLKIHKKYWSRISLLLSLLTTIINFGYSQTKETKVMVLKIREEIDPRMSRYVELGLEQATEIKADLVLIDMDTYGGMVYDADKIRNWIIKYPKPIYVFINDNAASAGALISIATDSIYMAPGSTIGASTVVDQEGKEVSDKYQSYMRRKMRATAEATGRNPDIAEAMVGTNVSGDSTYKVGKVLTLSPSEAMKVGYASAQVNSIAEILKRSGISNYQLVEYEMDSINKLESIFLNPYLRSILILIILAGIYFEMQSPGIGFALLASIVAAVLYFVPSYIHGFAENWEILIFLLGIGLIALEIFVIPGFGIAGISGIILALAGLLLVMLENDSFDFSLVSESSFVQALTVLLVSIFGGSILVVSVAGKIIDSKAFKRLTLQERLDTKEGYTSTFFKEPMVGKTGKAYTVLRPSGKVIIDDVIYDAFSRNDFVNQGEEIVVIEESTTSLKVKKKE